MVIVDRKPLYKKYSIDIDAYKGISIGFDELKIRTVNCLKSANIYNVDQLLSLASDDLLKIKNFGKLSLNDIEDYVKSLESKSVEDDKSDDLVSTRIGERRNLIFDGLFNDELYEGLNEKETQVVNKYRIGYELLEKELINLCRDNPVYAYSISKMLNCFLQALFA